MIEHLTSFIDWALTEPESFYTRMISLAVGCFALVGVIAWMAVRGKRDDAS